MKSFEASSNPQIPEFRGDEMVEQVLGVPGDSDEQAEQKAELATQEQEEKESQEELEAAKQEMHRRMKTAFEAGDASFLLNNPGDMKYPWFPSLRTDIAPELIVKNLEFFFDELISLSLEKRGVEDPHLNKFLDSVAEGFFSGVPNIFETLHYTDALVYASRIARIEELRGVIGQSIMSDVVFMFNSPTFSTERLIKKVKSLDTGEQADVIHQLETIYSASIAHESWADLVTGKLMKILNEFKGSDQVLVKIVAECAVARVGLEEVSPSLGIIQFKGEKKSGRLLSIDATKSLSDKCISNLPMGYKMAGPCADAIIAIDSAGMPRYATTADVESIRVMNDLGTRHLQAIIESNDLPYYRVHLTSYVNHLGKVKDILMPNMSVAGFYANILGLSNEEAEDIIATGENVAPYFFESWEEISKRVVKLAEEAMEKIRESGNAPVLEFHGFDDVLVGEQVNPFAQMSKDDLLLLAQCMRPEVYVKIEEQLGMPIKAMSFGSLVHLLRFLANEDVSAIESLREVGQKYPNSQKIILESFFAASEFPEYGNMVLDICKTYNEEEINLILSKYIEFSKSAIKASADMLQLDHKQGEKVDTKKVLDETRQSLLVRGRKVMERYAYTQGQKVDAETIALELDLVTVDAITFGSFIRALRGSGVNAEQIAGTSLETLRGGAIDAGAREEMLKIFTQTRHGSGDPEKLIEASREGFESALESPAAEFRVLLFENHPIAFVRSEILEDGRVYLGSFNVAPELKGEKVAAAFLSEVLKEKNMDAEIVGEVWEMRPLAFYMRAGFEKAGKIENWHNTGEVFERIIIPRGKLNAKAATSTTTVESSL